MGTTWDCYRVEKLVLHLCASLSQNLLTICIYTRQIVPGFITKRSYNREFLIATSNPTTITFQYDLFTINCPLEIKKAHTLEKIIIATSNPKLTTSQVLLLFYLCPLSNQTNLLETAVELDETRLQIRLSISVIET